MSSLGEVGARVAAVAALLQSLAAGVSCGPADSDRTSAWTESRGDTTVVTTPDGISVPLDVVESVEILWRSDSLQWPVSIVELSNRMIVADRSRLHYLTREGVYLKSVGRHGHGPGEFTAIGGVGRLGPSLLVHDEGLHRLSVFDESGSLLDEHRVTPHIRYASAHFDHRTIRPIAGGYLQVKWPGRIPVNEPTYAAILWHGISNDSAALIGEWPDFELQSDGRVTYERDPLGPRALLAVGPAGRWAYGDGQQYCFTLARLGARAVRRVCRHWERAKVSRAVRHPDWDMLASLAEGVGRRLDALREAVVHNRLSDRFPSYDRLYFTESGEVWVRTLGPGRAKHHPYLTEQFEELRPPHFNWDVFGEDGQFKRTIRLPSHFEPRLIRERRAYGFRLMPTGDYAVALANW